MCSIGKKEWAPSFDIPAPRSSFKILWWVGGALARWVPQPVAATSAVPTKTTHFVPDDIFKHDDIF